MIQFVWNGPIGSSVDLLKVMFHAYLRFSRLKLDRCIH